MPIAFSFKVNENGFGEEFPRKPLLSTVAFPFLGAIGSFKPVLASWRRCRVQRPLQRWTWRHRDSRCTGLDSVREAGTMDPLKMDCVSIRRNNRIYHILYSPSSQQFPTLHSLSPFLSSQLLDAHFRFFFQHHSFTQFQPTSST